jgi:hypothetical protein
VQVTILVSIGAAILLGAAIFVACWYLARDWGITGSRDQAKSPGTATRGSAHAGKAALQESWPSLADELAVAWLVVTDGPEAGAHHMVVQGTNLIGRGSSCDIQLDDPTVSRQHARLVATEGQFLLQDLHSTSGTYVDGKQVDPSAASPIMDGSVVSVGNTGLVLRKVQSKP